MKKEKETKRKKNTFKIPKCIHYHGAFRLSHNNFIVVIIIIVFVWYYKGI